MNTDLTDEQLEQLYGWIDEVPLTRPKKNFARDFSDGVLVAEVMKHHFPKSVEMHHYTAGSSSIIKRNNWLQLNKRVFRKVLGIGISDELISDISNCKPGVIEKFLMEVRSRIDKLHDEMSATSEFSKSSRKGRGRQGFDSDMPEVDQNMVSPGRLGPLRGTKGRTKGQQRFKTKLPPDFERVTNQNLHSSDAQSDFNMGSGKVQVQPMDPRSLKDPELSQLYQEKALECAQKDETIQILHAKIRRLNHLASLKDTRIDDLTSHLKSLQPPGGYRK